MLYDIDGENYVKTSHDHSGKVYAGTLGEADIDLQRKPKSKEEVIDDESSVERSDISNMSRYQLITRLRKLGDISDSDKGPAPQRLKVRVLTLIISSDESDSNQEAANIGQLTPATLLGLQGGHSNMCQAVRGKQSIT